MQLRQRLTPLLLRMQVLVAIPEALQQTQAAELRVRLS